MSEERIKEPGAVVLPPQMQSKRTTIQQRFDRENPAFVHVWQDGKSSREELAMQGLEPVTWPDNKDTPAALRGKEVRPRQDILCRIPREVFEAERKQGEGLSRALVQQSMKGKDEGEDIKWQMRDLTRKPKDARDIGKPVN
jgi:hypothetical protein